MQTLTMETDLGIYNQDSFDRSAESLHLDCVCGSQEVRPNLALYIHSLDIIQIQILLLVCLPGICVKASLGDYH
jgi:hypothetical protein